MPRSQKPDNTREPQDRASDFAQSFLKHQTALKRFISRFFSANQDIEDITQEAYLRAFDAQASSGVRVNSPKSFLFRVAKNVALNELARKSRLMTDYIEDSVSPNVLVETRSAEDEAIGHEKLALFCRAAVSLPQQCRRAFLMRKVHGMSHQDIATELGISVSTVEKHVAAGLLRCSVYLREHGYPMDSAVDIDRKRGQSA